MKLNGPIDMDMSIYYSQREQALANLEKSVNELKAGDFVYLYESGLKNDCGVRDILNYSANHDCEPYRRMCCLEGVYHVATDADLLAERFDNPHTGGSASDYIEQGTMWHQLTDEQKETIYTLCTLVISDESGRYLAFDREGYSYNRYVLFPIDYRTMYAQEIEEEREKEKERERIQAEREEAEREEIRQIFAERYGFLPKGERLSKVIRLLLKSHGIEAKVTEKNGRYQWRELNIRCADEDREEIKLQIQDAYSLGYFSADSDAWGHHPYIGLFATTYGAYDTINWR